MFTVLIKPKYVQAHVERIYDLCRKHLGVDFDFVCLTDEPRRSELPIRFIDVSKYELDTWWNKMLMFKRGVSGPEKNLYFDLDVNIVGDASFLLDEIYSDALTVVDTPWKDDAWKREFYLGRANAEAFSRYGNTSVVGWFGDSQDYLTEYFFENIFEVTSKHFGDDTFLNSYPKKRYFSRKIECDISWIKYIEDPRIFISYKSIVPRP